MTNAASELDGRSALDWLLADRQPRLVPTPWLSDRRFEDFVEHLLKVQPLLGTSVRHVAEVARWGVPGDKQDGIDLFGRFNDDVPAAWQCKHLKVLNPANVREAIGDLTFEGAEEFYLVYADVAKVAARNEVRKHPGWHLWDRRDLTAMLRAVPVQTQRDVLDEFWGLNVRRLFLQAPDDAFMSLESFKWSRLNPDSVMNDLGPLAGRTEELAAMRVALDRASESYRKVVLVSGPGGRGKSRLLADSFGELRGQRPSLVISCLAPARVFGPAAMSELWVGTSVVVIDDAHRDPKALAPLLAFARGSEDVQIVLATRPSGLRLITEEIIEAGFGPSEWLVVPVDELARVEAERLVKELTEGMGLSFGLRSYLAGQAEHSPHVAIIATNLIKRGELTASLGVDDGLRQTVLNRYREVLAPDVDGVSGATTRKVLATYAAVGTVDSADRDLVQRIASFCELTVVDLARLIASLRDHGLLLVQGESLRVVPDVVADSVLEEQAAFENFDTGFASALWEAFGDGEHQHQLATTLGELDWRLSERGGPAVMDSIWAKIRERILVLPYGRLHDALSSYGQLAATQPRAMTKLLEDLRTRLAKGIGATGSEPDDNGDDDQLLRQRLGLPRIGYDDVLSKMPELYARAAVNNPDLLEIALDAIWAIRSEDARPPHSNPNHAERMIEDHLGNLAKLPDPTFPERIVARVQAWLAEPAGTDKIATPLFALKPLLAKEQVETVQSAPLTLSMHARGTNPSAMRTVRDQIRHLLQGQAVGDDLRRAGEAVRLLEEALRQPHGYFGQPVGRDRILAWQDDDLATVATLTEIAMQSRTPALRRRIRKTLAWPAEHATSPRVMHGTLTTLAALDAVTTVEDDIADDLLSNRFVLSKVLLADVPPLEDIEAAQATELDRIANLTEEERQAERSDSASAPLQGRRDKADDAYAAIVDRLVELGSFTEMLTRLDRTARDVASLESDSQSTLWAFWRHLAGKAPELLPDILQRIANGATGPLDRDLTQLIDLTLQCHPGATTRWLHDAVSTGRTAVRMAVARGFDRHTWESAGDLARIWGIGSSDPDPQVADAFLAASGAYLRAAPTEAVQVLLDKEISSHSAATAIETAGEYDCSAYGSRLDRDDANAIFQLIARADQRSYGVQTTVAGIALRHPDLVLDYLHARAVDGTLMHDDIQDLGAAFGYKPDILPNWIVARLVGFDDETYYRLGRVLQVATNDNLTEAQGIAFAARIPTLDPQGLRPLCQVLSYVDTWPLRHPKLATAAIEHARQTGRIAEVSEAMQLSMHPNHWSGMNGESPELAAGLARAREAAKTTDDPQLQVAYERAGNRIQQTIDTDLQRHENDTQSGWD